MTTRSTAQNMADLDAKVAAEAGARLPRSRRTLTEAQAADLLGTTVEFIRETRAALRSLV